MPGPAELTIILFIILILFGAGKLPQVGEALGLGLKKFREASDGDDGLIDVTPKASREIPESDAKDTARA